MAEVRTQFKVICAIDFGTAGSGFSLLYTNEPDKVALNPAWPHSPGSYEKTATELLLKRDTLEVIEFGFAARHKMAGMDSVAAKNVLHFQRFKMFLDPKTLRASKVKACNCDVVLPLTTVIAKVLEVIKNAALREIANNGTTLPAEQVMWCLTVPAIWDTAAKQVMLEAAAEAGLGGSGLDASYAAASAPTNVTIALEPEAASLQCMLTASLSLDFRRPGTRYIVIDAGGGTVDITVHEIRPDLTVKELLPPSGGAWGSTFVDDLLLKMLEDVFGQSAVAQAKQQQEWVDVLLKIETNKISLTPQDVTDGAWKLLQLDVLAEFLPSGSTMKSLVEAYNKRTGAPPGRRMELRGASTLRIPSALIKGMMDPLIGETVKHVRGLLETVTGVSLVFLVGGFAESRILQDAVMGAFNNAKRRVVVPPRPGVAVVIGAAHFGLNPGKISSRSAPYTYGIDMLEPWDAAKHAGKKKVTQGGVDYCPAVLDKFITVGDPIDVVGVVKRTYVPVVPDQTEMEIPVYRSTHPNPRYTTDEGVRYVGTLKMAIPGIGRPSVERRVEVSMQFGGTNVVLSALHVMSGERVNASYREFLSDAELPPRPEQALSGDKEAGSIDLCVCMDCTGSMGGWISQCKTEALGIAEQIKARFPKIALRTSFVGYRDVQDDPRFEISPFSNGPEKMREFLGSVRADGGGDSPEDIMGALVKVSELNWSGQVRVMVHIADAPCHGKKYHNCDDSYPDGDPTGLTPEYVLGRVAQQGIDYYFMRLNNSTATMETTFSELYQTICHKPLHIIHTGANVAALLPSVVECVTKSVTAFRQTAL